MADTRLPGGYDFYYGDDPQQFQFIRIPKPIISNDEFKGLSADAKVLFGLLLDRTGLSQKNQWVDDENRVYIIFTVDEIEDALNVSRPKAVKSLSELEKIGLITKKKLGQGKPNLLYVKNFMRPLYAGATSRSLHPELLEVKNINSKKSRIKTSGSSQNEFQEVQDPNSNKNKNSDNNIDNFERTTMDDWLDVVIDKVEDQLGTGAYRFGDPDKARQYDLLAELVLDTLADPAQSFTISGRKRSAREVKNLFAKLEPRHLEYVMECMKENKNRISNMKAYLISTLYNSYYSEEFFWENKVQADQANAINNADKAAQEGS